MTITNWPESERPREKLLKMGPSALSDAELLAIFLRTGISGRTAVDLSRDLLSHFGGLRGVLSANRQSVTGVRGIGSAKLAQLQAALELGRRYMQEALEVRDLLTDTLMVKQFLKSQLMDLPHEVFACLYLDNQHRVIEFEKLFRGTIDSASVHPREVVKRALQTNAAAMIVSHNHPSGFCEPSCADISLTRRLKESLALVEVRLIDHILIAEGEPYSFAEHGHL